MTLAAVDRLVHHATIFEINVDSGLAVALDLSVCAPGRHGADSDAARIADDAQFDGLHVLRTNSTMNMLSVALAYRELWRVEAIFRTAKSTLETRPIFHQSDAAIAGHLFCSFLALLLRKELDERLAAAGVTAEWNDIVRDLDRVEQVTLEQGGKCFVLRPQAPGCAGAVFKAVGVALPPLVQQLTGPPPPA